MVRFHGEPLINKHRESVLKTLTPLFIFLSMIFSTNLLAAEIVEVPSQWRVDYSGSADPDIVVFYSGSTCASGTLRLTATTVNGVFVYTYPFSCASAQVSDSVYTSSHAVGPFTDLKSANSARQQAIEATKSRNEALRLSLGKCPTG